MLIVPAVYWCTLPWGLLGFAAMGLVIHLCMLSLSFPAPLPLVSAVTPLVAEQFAWELRFHPQWLQVDFVLNGIRHGVKLGFCPSKKLKSAKKNKPSAIQHASVIDAFLANEVSLGRVAGPFDSPSIPLPSPTSKLVVLVSFRKRTNQANGISSWICLPPGGLVSMMGLVQMSLLYITSLLIKLFAQCLAWGKGPSWLNLTLSPLSAMFLFTRLA